MTPKKTRARRRSRYDYGAIVLRIESARRAKEMSTRALAEAVGIKGFAWYRKIRGVGSTFALDEFSAIADALEAPPGWPFVEWE